MNKEHLDDIKTLLKEITETIYKIKATDINEVDMSDIDCLEYDVEFLRDYLRSLRTDKRRE